MRSGLSIRKPSSNEWELVYWAAAKLIQKGCINSVLKCRYSGLFVDEYQDCIQSQHTLISALADILPCCIFGDPLQAIFGFGNNRLPRWDEQVLQKFPPIAELRSPHRWLRVGNKPLGEWLMQCRDTLMTTGQVNLENAPPTVRHYKLPTQCASLAHQERTRLVIQALAQCKQDNCIVIGNSRNENGRATLAKRVKATAIEPIACKSLTDFVAGLETAQGTARLDLVLTHLKEVMTGANCAGLLKAAARLAAQKQPRNADELATSCVQIQRSQDLRPILELLEKIPTREGVWVYRRELLSSLCCALRAAIAGTHPTLEDAIWEVQNRRRHSGRRLGKRNVGSTLLVKGLEFDHAVVVDSELLTRNELYVALTRGSRSLTVISESPILRPRAPVPSSA